MLQTKIAGTVSGLLGVFLLGCPGNKTPAPESSPPPVVVDPGPQSVEIATCTARRHPSPESLLSSPAPDRVQVYIDRSDSMEGFAAGQDRYQAVLEALRPALLEHDIFQREIFGVGKKVIPATKGATTFIDYTNTSLYDQGETNLAGVLESEIDADPASSSLALVLTDGVMSLRAGAGQKTSLTDCERGSDVHCLAFKLGRLLESRAGFWIVGIRSRFKGRLYSELQKTGGASLGDVDLPNRPFYLWVLAKNPLAGRKFITTLLRRIDQQPDRNSLFVLEVSPGEIPWRTPSPTQPKPDRELFPDSVRQGAVLGDYTAGPLGQPGTQVVSSKNVDGKGFGVEMRLDETPLSTSPGSFDSLARFANGFCLRWQDAPPKIPHRAFGAREDGTVLFALLISRFEDLADRRVTLVQQYVNESRAAATLPPLADWSTSDDRTVEAGSKSLYLEDFLYTLKARSHGPTQYEQPLLTLEFK